MKSRPGAPARRGALAIGHLAGIVAAPAFRRHGLGHGEIASAWTDIAGPDLAGVSRPVKLAWPRPGASGAGTRTAGGATLTVEVEGPRAIELQHAASRIMEAANALFGYRAVTRLRLVQAPPVRRRRTQVRMPVAPVNPDRFAGVRSADLRRALARLGEVAGSR